MRLFTTIPFLLALLIVAPVPRILPVASWAWRVAVLKRGLSGSRICRPAIPLLAARAHPATGEDFAKPEWTGDQSVRTGELLCRSKLVRALRNSTTQ